MRVQMVTFPETKVAAITHIGPRSRDHDTVRKLVRGKLEHRLLDPARYRSYGLQHTDARTVNPGEHRVEFCLSIETAVRTGKRYRERNDIPLTRRSPPTRDCAHGRYRDIVPAPKCAVITRKSERQVDRGVDR